MKNYETDILIIGAGPVGLFAVFEAGLLKMRCHLVDVLPQVGGQLTEIYPKKPIYNIPGCPGVLAGDLVQNLMKQIEPFHPTFTLGERAETLTKREDGRWEMRTAEGTSITAPAVFVAGGLAVLSHANRRLLPLGSLKAKAWTILCAIQRIIAANGW